MKMSKVFLINRELINPRFESYKIISEDENKKEGEGVYETSFAIPGRVLGAGMEQTKQPILGYKEVHDRARAKYLVSSKDEREAAYIDVNGFVILIGLNDSDNQLIFRPIYRIQTDIQQSIELPSLISIKANMWLISDGNGRLTFLKTHSSGALVRGSIANEWEWKEGGELIPFRIIASSDRDGEIDVVIQRICKTNISSISKPGIGANGTTALQKRETIKTTFQLGIAIIKVDDALGPDEKPKARELFVRSTFELEEAHQFAFFQEDGSIVLFSESIPRLNNVGAEITKGEGQIEKSDNNTANDTFATDQRRIPPYAWTQTSETITVLFKLPKYMTKEEIRCQFNQTHLHLGFTPKSAKIQELNEIEESDHLAFETFMNGRLENRQLWAEVEADECVWTWEKENDCSLLTLHLEKKHAGTRWPQVFKEKEVRPFFQQPYKEIDEDNEDDDLDEVPETIDASELINMLNGIEKYTTDRHDMMNRPVINQNASLLQDGLEEEDADVGIHCVVSLLNVDGSVKVLERDVIVLASPLNSMNDVGCVTIRDDLDGLAYAARDKQFKHVDCLPALSYVLASKRECKKVYNIREEKNDKHTTTILAFDSITGAQGQGGAGNLFVYYSPFDNQITKVQNQGKSRVIRLGNNPNESPSGPLIDVNLIKTRDGKRNVLVLCQERILMLHNVL